MKPIKTITPTIVLLFMAITCSNAQSIQKWLKLGTGTSKNLTSQPSMAFDRNGNLFLVYTDQSSPQNKATLKKFDGQNWTTLSSQFTKGQAQFVTLALDTGDVPYVAFQEPHPVTKKITVMKFNGNGWDTIGARGFATADFNNPELAFAFDQNNNIYVAYRENSSGKASIARYFGVSWTTTNSADITEGNATRLALSIYGSYGYLAFSNGNRGGKLSVITQTVGGSWVYVGDSTLSTGAVDYINCRRFISNSLGYHAVTYKDLGDGKAYYKTKLDNANWTASTPFSDGLANYVTLGRKRVAAFDGNLYCGYADGTASGNATVRKLNVSVSTASSTVGKQGFTDTLGIFAGAFYATLGIDKHDSLYMAVQSFNEYTVFKYRHINTNLTAIRQLPDNSLISVYPSPARDMLNIEIQNQQPCSIRLTAADGKILFEKESQQEKKLSLDISTYKSGLYFIEINQNGKVQHSKILIE
ncbi:MAG TPA: T9SS type A sorting domain-containing protein [Bacteroidia bacterium]|nr:T9SS type A sorting domain-containing protein [Bacteroidia bacterium]